MTLADIFSLAPNLTQMEIDKKNYLVSGPKDDKTREKIRLKMRLIFNNYKRCRIGTAHVKEIPGIGYSFQEEGYKHLFFIYKSASVDKVSHFEEAFREMYRNEIEELEKEMEQKGLDEKGQYVLYVTGKTKKKVF